MTDTGQTDTGDTLAKVVAALPKGGEVRSGQAAMAVAVERSIETGRHLVVQAGTGTGKTLAYLVPAIRSGRKTVVTTATKALQDQLGGKDLPFLQETIGGFTSAVLKGRANYACQQRLIEVRADRESRLAGTVDTDDGLEPLLEWASRTEVGDRAELDVEPSDAAWGAISVTSEECPGASKCPAGEICFAERARAAAAAADIIVVNTYLYGTHLASDGAVLPEHDVVVVDEAHRLEEVISSTAGVELTAGRIHNAARVTARVLAEDKLVTDLAATASDLGELLDAHLGTALAPMPDDLAAVLDRLRAQLDRVATGLRAVPTSDPDVAARRLRAMSITTALATDLVTLRAVPDGHVAWVEGMEGRGRLRMAPIDVAAFLAERLWSGTTAILTSATIPLLLVERLGLDPRRTDELDVGSPFDHEHQALLYCAAHLPDPRAADWEASVHTELAQLILAAGGRTLALFTSWRAMKAAVAALSPVLGVPVIAQGELPKPALLRRFTDEPETCLFATLGFWEGVDVPGQTLSLVTIDRLPFARPDDPLLEARRAKAGRRAFELIDLPRASTLLAQGAGRLIRSSEDRGVVAVFDSRLATAKYRWDLVNALPPMRRTRDPEEARRTLRELRGA